jgi:hypothetical protein
VNALPPLYLAASLQTSPLHLMLISSQLSVDPLSGGGPFRNHRMHLLKFGARAHQNSLVSRRLLKHLVCHGLVIAEMMVQPLALRVVYKDRAMLQFVAASFALCEGIMWMSGLT